MNKYVKYAFCIASAVMILTSCSDDNEPVRSPDESFVETTSGGRVTRFTIIDNWVDVPEHINDFTVTLYQLSGCDIHNLRAEAEQLDMQTRISIHIPDGIGIADGKYYLQAFHEGASLGNGLMITFKKEVAMITEAAIDYAAELDTEGSGTAEDPFIIKTTDTFKNLSYVLAKDESHAAGRYFKQTRDLELPQQGWEAGRGHVGQAFAGIYDGDGNTISNLCHMGYNEADLDSGIGLFSALYNGAEIKNLTIQLGSCTGVNSNFGAVAGTATGTVKISDIAVVGTTAGVPEGSGSRIGGVIGHAKDCNLTISGYDMNVTITNHGSDLGGVVGLAENCTLSISGVDTYSQSFRIIGTGGDIGGLVGEAASSKLTLSDCNIEHTTSDSDNDIFLVSGTSHVGGAVGNLNNPSSECLLEKVYIYCPVGYKDANGAYSGSSMGGFIGVMGTSQKVEFKNCYLSGIVVGGANVGGLIGWATASSNICLSEEIKLAASNQTAVGIYGHDNVGGLFGGMEAGTITITGNVGIYAPVVCTNMGGGGVAGDMRNTHIDVSKITLSETMSVSGGSRLGGLVGEMYSGSQLYGQNSFNFDNGSGIKIPSFSQFTPNFKGSVIGTYDIGGAVGRVNSSTVRDICVSASVTGTSTSVGGVIGSVYFVNDIRCENITFNGFVNAVTNSVGGICGSADGSGRFHDCINYGSVYSSEGHYVGGVVGYVDYVSGYPYFRYCVNAGKVSGNGSVGGVAGYLYGLYGHPMFVEYCANYGEVVCSGNTSGLQAYGGIVGAVPNQETRIRYCVNHGYVHGSGSYHGVGGIVGSIGNDPDGAQFYEFYNAAIESCANYGEINNDGFAHIGGIVGYLEEGYQEHDSYIYNCYNRGAISSDQDDDNGGIVGYVDHLTTVKYCINFGKVSYGNAMIGDKKASLDNAYLYMLEGSGGDWKATDEFSESEKGLASTYEKFDFDNVWMISGGWPLLKNCPFQSVPAPSK